MTINIKTAKVRDNPDLVRDMDTKAILANDHDKYNDHKQKKDLLKKLIAQGNEFESLKKDVDEIKCLLRELINNK